MSVGIILIGLFIFAFTVVALYDITFKDAKCEGFQRACILFCCCMAGLLIILGVIWYCSGQIDTEPLSQVLMAGLLLTVKSELL